MARLEAALLDVDGTLIDSNDAHASAWVEVLSGFGYPVPFARVRELIGKGGDKLLPETVGLEKGSEKYEQIAERRKALFKEKFLPELRPFRGARELLQAMKDGGLALVVATSATPEEVGALLEVAQVRDLVKDVKTSKDAKNSKPDPDIVRAALAAAGCDASEAIMLGDTPYDVEAAVKAGVEAVALRCGGWEDAALARARAIYDDPADLLAHLETSPFARRR
ncbi:MAG TPA: HAD-IA family hydrolase [Polyangiaceae bacterium]|jgi:HAD superfamily hydrolase (TIGR01509 family)|nr:HAD-IA family hydrolase [Polyangiaceae bacterium]